MHLGCMSSKHKAESSIFEGALFSQNEKEKVSFTSKPEATVLVKCFFCNSMFKCHETGHVCASQVINT